MNEQQMTGLMETIYQYVKMRLVNDGVLKNYVQRKNATVTSVLAEGASNIGKIVKVMLPYDDISFSAKNETGVNLNQNDLVVLEYNMDLKNAIAVYKIK